MYVLESFIIPIEIPPVENLVVVDHCTTIRASWDITEGSCPDLLYNVTLLSSVDGILQGPFITIYTFYTFNNTETLTGNFTVNVTPINGNARGAVSTNSAVINISLNG